MMKLSKRKQSYTKIAALTVGTGIFYAVSVWIAIPLAIALGFCIMNHCDTHCK
jgi:uncharacterized oligopeptide transporter (OPT) family protein